jgi:hypothetical protein
MGFNKTATNCPSWNEEIHLQNNLAKVDWKIDDVCTDTELSFHAQNFDSSSLNEELGHGYALPSSQKPAIIP